jgi:hypothetical protein
LGLVGFGWVGDAYVRTHLLALRCNGCERTHFALVCYNAYSRTHLNYTFALTYRRWHHECL